MILSWVFEQLTAAVEALDSQALPRVLGSQPDAVAKTRRANESEEAV